ncbi:hypothetical protein PRUPE_6G046800 [Prunus persica]|uniref:Cytochrome P450 n=1 Tax=Prunus persica TaxID=3760 RepID=A0A251NM19_PRUPE|nr:isoleucine N-monooxygenase 2 [Prunus persica]ONH99739.1 hypothetical protein PRUPE_6G046800 [Prunus persica]
MEANVGFLTLCLAITLVRFLMKRYWHQSKINDNNNKAIKQHYPLPPTPKGLRPWPIVGNLPEMLMNKPTFRWIHKLMEESNTEIACIRLANVHVIPVSCPILSREILKKQDATFATRPLSISTFLITKGYITTVMVPFGEQWKKMRKVITSELLSPMRHKWLTDKRIEEADHLVRYVFNQCNNEEGSGIVDLRLATQHYCANVIKRMIFNQRYFTEEMKDGGPSVEEQNYVNAVFDMLRYIYAFSASDYISCLRGLDLDGHEKIIKDCIKLTRKRQDPVIEERIREHQKLGGNKVSVDLLDILISLKDASGQPLLSPDEIKGQVNEMIMAAVDNPSNAAEWAIAEMINQPHLFEKARQELDAVVGKERQVQESDLSQLNFVKACAREAFRLHPVAPFNVPHVSMADTTVGDYFIPKGSHVMLSRIGLGRNPKIWDEPLKYKPERHLKDDGSGVVLTESELRFISFSTGMRGCVASTLGTSMTVMLFARLLHGFTWEAPPNESRIDLTEADGELLLAKPLLALAKPRLPAHVYQT